MKMIKKFIIVVVVAATLFWAGAVLTCEIQTAIYGHQFINLYREYTMIATPDYLKVLEYSDKKAVVYYVSTGKGGNILSFTRENSDNGWCFLKWETVWSSTGSASGFVWPYIR